ncbi:MAG: DMT family transporter [Alphaproteobacteria bacterium]|nr:DMT family transporter [Alphaproteobacteria bacterium]
MTDGCHNAREIDRRHARSLTAVLLAALFASSSGILVRQIEEASGWQVLFYRSLAFAGTVLIVILWRHRSRTGDAFRAVGWPGVIAAISLGSAFIAFIFSLLWTSVAEAVFILSSAPLFAALLGWLVLRERISAVMAAAMVVALAAIGLMLGTGRQGTTIDGAAAALVACLGYAGAIVALRFGRAVDMMPATCLSGVFAGLVCLVFVGDLAIGAHDLVVSLLLGSAQIGLQYILITVAARDVPAAQIALIMLIEVALAPLWVWIGVGEVPAPTTMIAGAVVVAAVAVQAGFNLRRDSV